MVSISVDTSRFRARYEKYVQEVRSRLESSWEEVLLQCLNDVLSRAPSPAAEQAYIVGEQGGTFLNGKPITDNPLRISFIRTPGEFLVDLIKNPTTYKINPAELSMTLGNVQALEAGSVFSWQNIYKKEPVIHSSAEFGYGVFSFFEWGKVSTQQAKFGRYKLKPGDGNAYWTSTKSYPRLGMYTDFNYAVFKNAVLEIGRSVQF